MKKLFSLFILSLSLLTASAADYSGKLKVKIGAEPIEQLATIHLTPQANGLYTLSLLDFTLSMEGNTMPVGNIVISDAKAVEKDGIKGFSLSREITITEGSDASLPWIGPSLGNVPIKIIATFTNDKLYANLDIIAPGVGTINVEFADLFTDVFHKPQNAGFEQFVGTGSKTEPAHWHGFGSAGGSYAGFVNSRQSVFSSTDVRPGSTGSQSVELRSRSVFFAVANGTLTTGRLIAGAISASSPDNHSLSDPNATELDQSGQPYVQPFFGQPDSLIVWVKFLPGKATDEAVVRAVIHDNTSYKDPDNGATDNVVAVAKANIAATNDVWKRLSIPFVYTENKLSPAHILFTFSTSATPGGGTGNDKLLIDDIELVYKTHPLVVSGISNVVPAPPVFYCEEGIYSLEGRRLDTAPAKGVYVVKKKGKAAVKRLF